MAASCSRRKEPSEFPHQLAIRREDEEEEDAQGASQRRAAPRGRSKVTQEQRALLVLGALLAAATIGIYRLLFDSVRAKRELQVLRGEYEALRASHTDSKVEPSACQKQNKETSPSFYSPNWERHGGKCYYFSSTQSSWKESRCWCQSRGGDLVKVESKGEQIFLQGTLRRLMVDHEDMFWIGLTDAEEEGTWLWVDGSPLRQSLSFWKEGQPDNLIVNFAEGQDCVRMGDISGSNHLLTWFDRSCVIHQRFICEKQDPTGNSTCA